MSDFQKDAMKLTAAALVVVIAIAALDSCILRPVIVESTWPESAEFSTLGTGQDRFSEHETTTWPESAEFSTLGTGQDRFSEHETNLEGWCVLVDHRTGAQYIVGNDVRTVCPLLDVDGTPLLVAEAGE